MLIETMPEVLIWSQPGEVLSRIHKSYVDLLGDRFGETVGRIRQSDFERGTHLAAEVRELPDGSLMRLIIAPEVAYRLLWPAQHSLAGISRFFLDAVTAEQLRLGGGRPPGRDLWTAIGDIKFSASGEAFPGPSLRDMMPLDFESPYAMNLDLDGMFDVTVARREPYNSSEQRHVLGRLERARDAIRATDVGILEFTVVFTKVLIFQRDPAAPDSFSSGSSGQYVGRSVLANSHLSAIDEVEIAEGIVHEAIHSLLYMQEQMRAWVSDSELYGPTPRTVSPWTQNALPLRPYLQAVFVWYGLLHFWCLALQKRTFDARRVQTRISQAAIGFLGRPLLHQIAQYSASIDPVLLQTVERMQARVSRLFAEVSGLC